MSSLASRQYELLRSRMSSVLLLAILVFATPGALLSQGTSDSQPRPQTKIIRRVLRPQTTVTPAASQQGTTVPGMPVPSTTAPNTTAPQQRTTAPQEPAPGRTAPPRQTKPDAPADSSFLQRLLAALASGLATSSANQPSGTKVQQPLMPNVIGMDTMSALRRLGLSARSRAPVLTYVIVLPAPALNPVDRIADQYPAPNTPVSRGTNVRLTLAGVARQPTYVIVPDVMGKLEAEAADSLRARGFAEDRVTKSVRATDSVGRVVGQNPAAGTRLARGGVVAIAIGQGVRVIMPKVTDLTLAAARQRLSAAGIDVARIRRTTAQSTRPAGSVVRQLPASGTVVLSTTQIVLTQAVPAPAPAPGTPPAPQTRPRPQPPAAPPPTVARTVVMPLLVGSDSATATRTLRDSGLTNYEIRPPVNGTAADTIRAQSPPSGLPISSTSRVVLTLGPPPTPPPPTSLWARLLVAAYVLAVAAAGALTVRRIWPPPQILTSVRVQPSFSDILGASGSLIDVSISLRSHVEHERSVLDLTGSPLE